MYHTNSAGMRVGEGKRFELRRARRSGSISARQQKKVAKYIRRGSISARQQKKVAKYIRRLLKQVKSVMA